MIAIVCLNPSLDRTLDAPGFSAGAVNKATLIHETPAGKGVNVARVLDALAVPSALLGLVGEDHAAQYNTLLTGTLVENHLHARPGRTRTNTTLLDPENNNETHIRESGMTVSEPDLAAVVAEILNTISPETPVLFSGSLPPGISDALFADAIATLRAEGFTLGVDIAGDALRCAVEAGATLTKPNRDELGTLLGRACPEKESLAKACAHVRQQYPSLTLLASDGARGATLSCPDGCWSGRARDRIDARNTVGAGDALLAGYLAAVLENAPPPDRLRRAIQTATAALACLAAGEINPTLLDTDVEIVEHGR